MEFTKRYFETIEEAEDFIQQINTLLGIPVNDDAVTRTYAEPQEVIFYLSDQSSNRTAIETNINSHYNVY